MEKKLLFLFFVTVHADASAYPRKASEGLRGRARGTEVSWSTRTRLCPRERIVASARTQGRFRVDSSAHPHGRVFLPFVWTVKTRPRGKRGRVRMSGRRSRMPGRNGRLDGTNVWTANFTVGCPFRHP
jgi:hypothetical protein